MTKEQMEFSSMDIPPQNWNFEQFFLFLNNFLKFVTHRNMFAFFFLISNASYLPQIVFHQSPPTQIVSSTVSSVGTVFIPFYFRIGPIDRNLSLFFSYFSFSELVRFSSVIFFGRISRVVSVLALAFFFLQIRLRIFLSSTVVPLDSLSSSCLV